MGFECAERLRTTALKVMQYNLDDMFTFKLP